MSVQLSIDVTLTEVNCGCCGGTYAINEKYRAYRAEKGGFWNCPYCQVSWGYSKEGTEAEKLRKELEAERKRKLEALARGNEERIRADKAEKKLKQHTRRVSNGVCPCCSRTFKQLARHMASKHPGYKP